MSTVNILCGHHQYPELPLLSGAWSFTGSHWNALPLLHDDVAELVDIWDFAHPHLPLEDPQRCSIGFKSGDMLGQSITFTLTSLVKKGRLGGVSRVIAMLEHCPATQFLEGGDHSLLQYSQYMLEFMFTSMKCNSQHLQHSCSPTPWHSHHHAWL